MEAASKIIIPPHLNAEVYRTNTADTDSLSYFDFIRMHTDGSILLGCSELTGRQWNGCAHIFKSVLEAQQQCKTAKNCIGLYTGTNDGCFLQNSSRVLLCEDDGTVSIWSIGDDDAWKVWSQEESMTGHDNAVLAVDCLDDGKEYVTAGADGNLKVWDVQEMICKRNYMGAHNSAIYGVATRPNSKEEFATASLDNYITWWTENTTKPVKDIVKNDCGVRCLQWLDENRLVFGDEAGILKLVDVRKDTQVLRLEEFPAAVHRIHVNSRSDKIAVCCDNKIVSVCTIDQENTSSVVYHDRHNHSNYVRDVAWDVEDTNLLHSVGWDSKVQTHKID